MKLPPSVNNRFESFVQALPKDYQQQAYEYKAFTRSRKIRSPLQLLQLVMLYCGLDLGLFMRSKLFLLVRTTDIMYTTVLLIHRL